MKKLCIVIVLILILSLFQACSKSSVVDFEADTFQSISVWTYDFTSGTSFVNWVYKPKDTKDILEYLINLKGQKVNDVKLSDSIELAFGVQIMTDEDIKLTFIGDYVVDSNGQYYRVDAEEVRTQCQAIVNKTREFDFVNMMNHRYISLLNGQWDSTYMTKTQLDDLELVNVIWSSEINSIKQDAKTLEYTILNNRDADLEFGEDLAFEVLIDGTWYDVRGMTNLGLDISWNSILNITEPGDTYVGKFYLEYYQPFPEGKYRLAKIIKCLDGESGIVSYEFTVSD